MKTILHIVVVLFIALTIQAQTRVEPEAGEWRLIKGKHLHFTVPQNITVTGNTAAEDDYILRKSSGMFFLTKKRDAAELDQLAEKIEHSMSIKFSKGEQEQIKLGLFEATITSHRKESATGTHVAILFVLRTNDQYWMGQLVSRDPTDADLMRTILARATLPSE